MGVYRNQLIPIVKMCRFNFIGVNIQQKVTLKLAFKLKKYLLQFGVKQHPNHKKSKKYNPFKNLFIKQKQMIHKLKNEFNMLESAAAIGTWNWLSFGLIIFFQNRLDFWKQSIVQNFEIFQQFAYMKLTIPFHILFLLKPGGIAEDLCVSHLGRGLKVPTLLWWKDLKNVSACINSFLFQHGYERLPITVFPCSIMQRHNLEHIIGAGAILNLAHVKFNLTCVACAKTLKFFILSFTLVFQMVYFEMKTYQTTKKQNSTKFIIKLFSYLNKKIKLKDLCFKTTKTKYSMFVIGKLKIYV
ncbi:hypothetical protein BpHYR1_016552 [Brachionus plicatilis]|uniref:Uncharacterized protein n=1 Tax=Brachionus plicatilis TaxID=10195 RepID=A0A3M7T2Y5_BRAPC|nr:hypothetical protein BpHYR1_016552 [Brachionus plicatilis]